MVAPYQGFDDVDGDVQTGAGGVERGVVVDQGEDVGAGH